MPHRAVLSTTSGYIGGRAAKPNEEQISVAVFFKLMPQGAQPTVDELAISYTGTSVCPPFDERVLAEVGNWERGIPSSSTKAHATHPLPITAAVATNSSNNAIDTAPDTA
jgi:hypothetical protein